MFSSSVKTNSISAWMLAARPKTLTGAAIPVMTGIAMAYADGSFHLMPAVLCLLFAFLMQIDANFVNDYYDFKKGIDDEKRLGPKRACAEGWITMSAMRRGIIFTTLLSCLTGLPLMAYGGWEMLLVGVACVVFCFLYTTVLAGMGLGDLLVWVFFGLIPVCVTYYIQTGTLSPIVVLLSIACGLVIDCLLIVNNYRDRFTDKNSGKITLVVRIGGKAAENLYLWSGIAAVILCQTKWYDGNGWTVLPVALYLFPHFNAWKRMKEIGRGRGLNTVLGMTARNIFIFGALLTIGLLTYPLINS